MQTSSFSIRHGYSLASIRRSRIRIPRFQRADEDKVKFRNAASMATYFRTIAHSPYRDALIRGLAANRKDLLIENPQELILA